MKNRVRLFLSQKRKSKKRVEHAYLRYRELARDIINQRIEYWSKQADFTSSSRIATGFYPLNIGGYVFTYNRVAIRNQKRRWGSCSSLKNLNFNYKLIFLPYELADYIIVHELCHLQELHHGPAFWQKVETMLPDYKERMSKLRWIEKQCGTSISKLTKLSDHYPGDSTTLMKLECGK